MVVNINKYRRSGISGEVGIRMTGIGRIALHPRIFEKKRHNRSGSVWEGNKAVQ